MSALATYMRKRCFLDMGWVIFGTALSLSHAGVGVAITAPQSGLS